MPELLSPRARRTRRLAGAQGWVGVTCARPANPSAVLDTWLTDALACGIPAVETFAAGVRQDEAAVKAALTMPWSSGQAEGQVNKLKLIKRQMYGRASFELLRRRVLLAA
ncbi:transposase [Azospirillum sp. TSO5]|uniref:transposase n=1 Tax=Azospirillum sp. TSO5 TaxID=716760 RepID=UPI002494CCAE|nr:transposase [Azospirillum sp. TSO5]